MSASQTGSQLTAKDINRALAMLTNAHPHHAQLIRQHRSKIHRAVLNGDRFPELQSVPFPVKPTKPKTVSLEMKTDVKGPSPCLVAVGGVIASHAQLLLGLLGAVGVDVLQPAKEWLSNIAAPLIDYLKSTADAVLEAVSALEKSQKFALFISACVGGGLLGYIWDAISNWSWWEWIRAVASWTATILSWLGSGFVALIGKVVGIIINAFNLFESVQAMITQCGKPTNPGQAPATPNYAYWSTADIGQGSGFVNMQIADIDGDHKKEIVQFWNNHGNMAAIVYQWNGSALTTKWSTDNIGQGSGYVSMQCGDIDGDGKEEIIQFWNHGGSMGAIVYQWNGSALVTKWSTDNIGQGSGYVSMLTADVTGDGKKEILQFWSNHGNMGVIVYQWNGSALVTKWSTDNIGQGSGFVSMQVGDIDADRKQEIIQFWNSHGSMGAIVYQWNGSALVTKWSTDNIGQGAGFVSMLTGDIGGDGKKEIVQFWNNHGSMAAIVYQWNGSALVTKWSTDNIGQGQGYVSMLTGDVFGHSYDELLQLWNNSGSLGFIMYEWTGTDLETAWYTENVGQGSGFVQMQIGDINGDGSDEVIQWWSNGGRMAAIVYAPGIFGKVVS